MTQSFEFRETTQFAVGTVGKPGQRVFYLQLGDAYDTASVKIEKGQVQALAKFLEGLLKDLPAPVGAVNASAFREPPAPDWTVGQIAVAVNEHSESSGLMLVIEEFVLEEDEDAPLDPIGFEGREGNTIRAQISVEQAAAFISSAEALLVKGRPPCRLCGQPLDSRHACPRLN